MRLVDSSRLFAVSASHAPSDPAARDRECLGLRISTWRPARLASEAQHVAPDARVRSDWQAKGSGRGRLAHSRERGIALHRCRARLGTADDEPRRPIVLSRGPPSHGRTTLQPPARTIGASRQRPLVEPGGRNIHGWCDHGDKIGRLLTAEEQDARSVSSSGVPAHVNSTQPTRYAASAAAADRPRSGRRCRASCPRRTKAQPVSPRKV